MVMQQHDIPRDEGPSPGDPDETIVLSSGNRMPVMGLGTWQLTIETAAIVAAAIAFGYRLIDTSGDYGTQPGVGEGLKRSEVDRDEIYLVTKIEETDDAYQAAQRNLRELDVDQVDLMLIHRPPKSGAGEELWRGLIKAKEDGLARDIGVSNYSIDLIEQLIAATGEVPAVNQVEWSPFGHSAELKRFAAEKGIVLQAYSPLTRGERLDDPVLAALADKHGKSEAQILIRWNLQSGVVPIPKANRLNHLKANIDVFEFQLDAGDMDRLDEADRHYSALGTLPYR